jgi:1,4-alpha-glucan branching enzyme
MRPRAIQNAEHWPVDNNIVTPVASGGAGFDVIQHDGLRNAVRGAVGQASAGAGAYVDLDSVAANLFPYAVAQGWQAVACIENHDIVKVGEEPRIPSLADGSNPLSWYARSRSRVAMTLLITAPGIPQIFMGQEFLESKQWDDDPRGPNLISWPGSGSADKPKNDYLRFSQDLIHLRWNQAALRGNAINVFHVHDQNRVIAFHRWIPDVGRDVVIAASLNESTYYGYAIGFPISGVWHEVFNSDVYDNFVNPMVAGNGGSIDAAGGPMHGLPTSAAIVIPANGVVVFARDTGD